jgi:uncharacterized SAM-binding protein YcdF (DUF218 family)
MPEAYTQFGKRESWTPEERELFLKVNTELLPKGNVDAVVWIEGDKDDRVKKTIEVFEHYNKKPLIVLSGGVKGNPFRPDKDTNPDGGNIPAEEIQKIFLEQGIPEDKIILEDQSQNAPEQAENVIRLAKENSWQRIVLVASTWHQLRLFLTFVNQLIIQEAEGIELINHPENTYPVDRLVPGRGKNTLEMIQEDLWRINRYPEDISRPAEGLKYLNRFQKDLDPLPENLNPILEKMA